MLDVNAENNQPRKVKDSAEKGSVIQLTYRHTYGIPIGHIQASKLNHGALFSNIFNFAKCVACLKVEHHVTQEQEKC